MINALMTKRDSKIQEGICGERRRILNYSNESKCFVLVEICSMYSKTWIVFSIALRFIFSTLVLISTY
jgi:hypothetical protein